MRTDHERISLEVHAHDMEAALSALVGATPRSPLRFEPRFSLEAQPAAALLRLLRFVMQEAEHDVNAFSSPLAAARVAEALLVSVLLAHPHNHSALIDARTRAAEPEHVRLVADYLEANLTRPISMAELSELSGVSVRSIQVGFRKFRGCSPVEFLRTRRLVRARTALSTTHLTVSQVAFACGFEHLGRFSAQYKAHFGEYPTETRSAGLGSLTARARAKTPIRTTRPARIG